MAGAAAPASQVASWIPGCRDPLAPDQSAAAKRVNRAARSSGPIAGLPPRRPVRHPPRHPPSAAITSAVKRAGSKRWSPPSSPRRTTTSRSDGTTITYCPRFPCAA